MMAVFVVEINHEKIHSTFISFFFAVEVERIYSKENIYVFTWKVEAIFWLTFLTTDVDMLKRKLTRMIYRKFFLCSWENFAWFDARFLGEWRKVLVDWDLRKIIFFFLHVFSSFSLSNDDFLCRHCNGRQLRIHEKCLEFRFQSYSIVAENIFDANCETFQPFFYFSTWNVHEITFQHFFHPIQTWLFNPPNERMRKIHFSGMEMVFKKGQRNFHSNDDFKRFNE